MITEMTGFTKLFGSIVSSTIWREDDKTRLVWITMLAMADKLGTVAASIPGLAVFANVKLEECQSALKKLMQPDEFSRTKDYEGRRIEEVDGGWRILNYVKYRELGMSEERKAYLRAKKRQERQMSTESTEVNKMSTFPSASVSVQENRESERKEDIEFAQFWNVYPRKMAKPKAYAAFLLALKKTDIATILKAVEAHKQTEQWQKEGRKFVPYPATWLNQCRWDDQVEPAQMSARETAFVKEIRRIGENV
jgi:hypothetical protein